MQTCIAVAVIACCTLGLASGVMAEDAREITPAQAFSHMNGPEGARTLFVDVRTPQEAMFLGMPTLADANVPWLLVSESLDWDDAKGTYAFVQNIDFVSQVEARRAAKGLSKSDPVFLICRSGDRSARAAQALARAGYRQVYSIAAGFEGEIGPDGRRNVNGWKNAGLPWSYRLQKAKMQMAF